MDSELGSLRLIVLVHSLQLCHFGLWIRLWFRLCRLGYGSMV